MSLQKKLIVLVTSTAIIILLALSILQIHWANTIVIDHAVDRVKQNINNVWEELDDKQEKITIIAKLISDSQEVRQLDNKSDIEKTEFLRNTKEEWDLDFLVVFDKNGKSISSIEEPASEFIVKEYANLPLMEVTSGYVNVPAKILENEQEELRKNCSIRGEIVDGLFIFTIVPRIDSTGKPNGIMLAGILINNSTAMLDEIQNNLFKDELYKGKRTGTVTIFSGPLRVATTVLLNNGERAIGTLVSEEVKNEVLNNGNPWTGRAKVVDNWYLSRYEPIYDPLDKIIGMLYIGELEQIYIDQKYNSLATGLSVILCIILFSVFISIILIRHTRKLELENKKVRFEFIRVLGHELKSPINAVDGYLQLMDQGIAGKIPEAYDKMIYRALIRIEFMRKLITDLLDLTKLESGQKTRELKTVDLYEVASESIETMTSKAKERNISIKLLSDQPINMIADRNEIEIIFNNLISNAVKYNRDDGNVEVNIKPIKDKIQISVKDTGIGMTEEEVSKLFEEFVRIKNSKTSNIQGSGLGLSIIKKIAKLYNGETHVISKADVGSTFFVNLKIK